MAFDKDIVEYQHNDDELEMLVRRLRDQVRTLCGHIEQRRMFREIYDLLKELHSMASNN